MKKVIYITVLVLLITSLILSGCSQSSPSTATSAAPKTQPAVSATVPAPPSSAAAVAQPKTGGTLILSRFTNDGVSLGDPLKHAGMNSWWESTPALETLLRTDASGVLIPWLATAWKEDSSNKSITLTLRQGVTFHDGTPFNADAVKWNLQHLIDGKHAATLRFSSVEVVDPDTVRINLTQWDSTVLINLAGDAGQMISPASYQKNGADWAANNPTGTGPFIFNHWNKNSEVAYDNNPNYWIKGQPYLDHIIWKVIPDMNSKAMSFQNKELDVILTMDLPQIKMLTTAGYTTLHQTVGSGADGYVPSSGDPNSPWSKLEVRQAAQYAINVPEYTTAIYGDEGAPTNQYTGKNSWAYNPNVIGYSYNPDKAKQLLAQAGYPTGFNSMMYGYQDQTMNKRALAIQSYLKVVGINLDIQIISDTQARDIFTQGKTWDGLITDTVGTTTDVVDTFSRYYTGGGKMFKSMATPDDWVQAVQTAVASPDFATKQKLTQGLMQMFTDKYCLVLLTATRYDNAFEQKYVHNSGVLRTVNTQMWTPEAAWVDK